MSFSALILTYNETDSLLECAESVIRFDECQELIVFQNFGFIDQSDVLSQIQRRCKDKQVHFQTHRSECDVSPAVAINQALSDIKTDTILYIQAGCSIEPSAIWTDVDTAFSQDRRCNIVGFPIISGTTIKGVSPFFSPNGHRYSEGGYVGQDVSLLDSKGIFRIPEPMPQAFALRKHGATLDTSAWYNFELTHLCLNSPVFCCSSFRIQHRDQGIRRNRAACSTEWKRRESIGATALKHHMGSRSKIGFEWALMKRYTLPYLGETGTPDAAIRNVVTQLSLAIGIGLFFTLTFLPLFLGIGAALLIIFVTRWLIWTSLTFMGKSKAQL